MWRYAEARLTAWPSSLPKSKGSKSIRSGSLEADDTAFIIMTERPARDIEQMKRSIHSAIRLPATNMRPNRPPGHLVIPGCGYSGKPTTIRWTAGSGAVAADLGSPAKHQKTADRNLYG